MKKKSLAKFMCSFPKISCRLNYMSFGDNRRLQLKLCSGAPVCPVSWSHLCQGTPPPPQAHRRKKRLVKLCDFITAFIFCPRHCPRKQQSPNPTAFLLHASLGTRWVASSWAHNNWLTCKCEQALEREIRNGHLRRSFIS